MPNVITNWERAEQVFAILLHSFRNNRFPYNESKPPQRRENLTPNIVWGSLEHACFLFCVCYYMRGGIQSDVAIVALSKLYDEAPDIFTPAIFEFPAAGAESHEDRIMRLLQSVRLNYKAREISTIWVKNFQKLHRFWKGDPKCLFENVTTYEQVCDTIMHSKKKGMSSKSPDDPTGFYGFREKMVSMLIYFLKDARIIHEFMFPVPVDFHVLRILVTCEILTVEGKGIGDDLFSPDDLRLEMLSAVRDLSVRYCQTHSVDPIELGDTMWLLSRWLCMRHPGNRVNKSKENKGRKTELTPVPVTWSKGQLEKYRHACPNCPLFSICKYNIPSAYYYVQGRLVIWSKRGTPQQQFFEFDQSTT